MDYGHDETEKILKKTEKQLDKVYSQAYKELKQKSDDYWSFFSTTDKLKRQQLANGEITTAEYQQWRLSHYLTGKRWQTMSDQMAVEMTNTNKIAASVINGHLPDVYALNANYSFYQIEKDLGFRTSFTLYDRQTVERLVRDNPNLLPWQARINTPEDIRYNKKNLTSAVTQGILQGESIDQIADRMVKSPLRMCRNNAITNARTMTTSAQNGGRIDSYKRAESMGIHLKKQWVAQLNDRTRHEHRILDGQIVEIDEKFTVEGYEIEYPGDPNAEPEMVYNCRCSTIPVLAALENGGYNPYVNPVGLKGQSYEEWKYDKQNGAK